jgi:hypothetical protein
MTEPTKKFPAKHMLELHYVVQNEHFHRIGEIASDYEEELATIGLTSAQYVKLVKKYKAWHDGMLKHLPSLIEYFEDNHFDPFEDENGFELSSEVIVSWLHALQDKVKNGSGSKSREELMKKIQQHLDAYEKHLYSLPMAEEPTDDNVMEEYWKKVHDILGKDYPSYQIKDVDDIENALQKLQNLITTLLDPLWLSALPVLQEFEQNLAVHIPRMEAPIHWNEDYTNQVIGLLDGLYDDDTTKSAMALFHRWYYHLEKIVSYDNLFKINGYKFDGIDEMYNQIGVVYDQIKYAPDYARTVEGLRALLHYISEVKKAEELPSAKPFPWEEQPPASTHSESLPWESEEPEEVKFKQFPAEPPFVQQPTDNTNIYNQAVALAQQNEIISTTDLTIITQNTVSIFELFDQMISNKVITQLECPKKYGEVGSTKPVSETKYYQKLVAMKVDEAVASSILQRGMKVSAGVAYVILEEMKRNNTFVVEKKAMTENVDKTKQQPTDVKGKLLQLAKLIKDKGLMQSIDLHIKNIQKGGPSEYLQFLMNAIRAIDPKGDSRPIEVELWDMLWDVNVQMIQEGDVGIVYATPEKKIDFNYMELNSLEYSNLPKDTVVRVYRAGQQKGNTIIQKVKVVGSK